MLILLSPAKTINYKPVSTEIPETYSIFEEQAKILSQKILTSKDIAKTLDVSEALGELNRQRFEAWHANATPPEGAPAAWAYRGEVYFGLSAEQLSAKEIQFAETHVRIVSGLYGLLRLTDIIMPYRLEMKTKIKGSWGANLYDFWQGSLAHEAEKLKPTFILNCASQEYYKALKPHLKKDLEVITPKFLHDGPTGVKPKMAFAKYSRGLMARWAITTKLKDPADIIHFNVEGYTYDQARSTPGEPVFIAPAGFTIKGRFKKT